MLARLVDGETMVVAGFSRVLDRRDRSTGQAPGSYFGRSPAVTNRRTEVVVLLTPKILHEAPD